MPTSLTYIILSTRGYSPRIPDADVDDDHVVVVVVDVDVVGNNDVVVCIYLSSSASIISFTLTVSGPPLSPSQASIPPLGSPAHKKMYGMCCLLPDLM